MEDIALAQPAGSQQNQDWIHTQQTANGERAGHRLVRQCPQNRAQPKARQHRPTPAESEGAGQAGRQPDRRHSVHLRESADQGEQHQRSSGKERGIRLLGSIEGA